MKELRHRNQVVGRDAVRAELQQALGFLYSINFPEVHVQDRRRQLPKDFLERRDADCLVAGERAALPDIPVLHRGPAVRGKPGEELVVFLPPARRGNKSDTRERVWLNLGIKVVEDDEISSQVNQPRCE